MAEIQADFDRIALFSNDEWNPNSHYHAFLLKHVPLHCTEALEIGCGTGRLARLLAQRAERVMALDLAPQMIRIARDRAKHLANIEFQVGDAATWQFPAERFDCIASIATLHHLPLGEMLGKMRRSLTVNGILLVLDLFRGEGLSSGYLGLAPSCWREAICISSRAWRFCQPSIWVVKRADFARSHPDDESQLDLPGGCEYTIDRLMGRLCRCTGRDGDLALSFRIIPREDFCIKPKKQVNA